MPNKPVSVTQGLLAVPYIVLILCPIALFIALAMATPAIFGVYVDPQLERYMPF